MILLGGKVIDQFQEKTPFSLLGPRAQSTDEWQLLEWRNKGKCGKRLPKMSGTVLWPDVFGKQKQWYTRVGVCVLVTQ